MDKLLTADDVAAVLQVSRRTAYSYMQQMVHTEKPMRVTEADLRAWISDRTVVPMEKAARRRGRANTPVWGRKMPQTRDYHLQRRRD